MAKCIGTFRPRYPFLGICAERISDPLIRFIGRLHRLYTPDSRYARKRSKEFKRRLDNGENIYLMGIGPSGHNSAAALVKVSPQDGLSVICNNEEERYTAIKNDGQFPGNSLDDINDNLEAKGIDPGDIFAVLASWDYIKGISTGIRTAFEEFPYSFYLLMEEASPHMNFRHFISALQTPKKLRKYFNSKETIPIIGMRHHDNHAYYPYAMSPFALNDEPTMIIVMDGFGDDGSISQYFARENKIELFRKYPCINDSQGLLYAVISSTQGGWEPLSSEGRYMGASAWGDTNRLTNPFYKKLRQIVYFAPEGKVFINRSLINYHRRGQYRPYNRKLESIIGPPIPPEKIWNPDMILNVDDIEHAEITQERVDKAAALQMIYEDVLFHLVDHMIRISGSSRLILSGGTALNCVANMKLLDHFNDDYYKRTYRLNDTRLHLWIPPNPSDTGTAMGAAYNFALKNGAKPGEAMKHAFICGNPPKQDSIAAALKRAPETRALKLGNINETTSLESISDLAAFIISNDDFLGIYQGSGETGPRALGHRTIMANPCNPESMKNLNSNVKFREKIRPLAPMLTLDEADKFFYLSPGASDSDYNAYNYMILTVMAKEEALRKIPAVIHKDGTSRIQIARQENDPLSFAILLALKKYLGVSVVVNTSLNVGTPIVHSPEQAVQALHRSKGMSGLIMIEENGDAYLTWHTKISPPKDGGKKLQNLLSSWNESHPQAIKFIEI